MRPVSARWAAAVLKDHKPTFRATIIRREEETPLEAVTGGSVTLDAKAACRGRCDVTVGGDADLVPSLRTDLLAPYGNEIKLERGFTYPNGDEEFAALGVFRIEDVDVDDSGDDLSIRISGNDRSARIIDARFEEPYNIATATNVGTAILEVLQEAWGDFTYDFAEVENTTSAAVAEEGGDRWALAQSLATSIGCDLYFDGDGKLILRPIPTPADVESPYLLREGVDGVLITAGRGWTRQGAFNRVIATGENTSSEVIARGVATDDNEDSPTYYYGPFGQVPRFYTSPFITTDTQAEKAAAGILARELGATQTINFGVVVDPALEPGDIVRIRRERAGIRESNVIDTLTIPLAFGEAMTGTTRATLE
jgi:hypothetical protein